MVVYKERENLEVDGGANLIMVGPYVCIHIVRYSQIQCSKTDNPCHPLHLCTKEINVDNISGLNLHRVFEPHFGKERR